MNELIDWVIKAIKEQQGMPPCKRHGMCWLIDDAPFSPRLLTALHYLVNDKIPDLNDRGMYAPFWFPKNDRGDLKRIKLLMSLKKKYNG